MLADETYAFPASFAQQRLWIVDQLARHSGAYNMPFAYRLRGPLSVAALRAALQALVDRHEALRTTFVAEGGSLKQVVHGEHVVDLEGGAVDEPGAAVAGGQLAQILEAEAHYPFDLAAGPLFRARLIGLGAAEHILILNMHHIVSDGWSHDVLERDLAELYDAAATHRPAHLPNCRSSTPTTPCGSAIGCAATCWSASWATGAHSLPICRRCSCPPTTRARRSRASRARRCAARSRRMWPGICGGSRSARAPRCS
ncbi:MAG: hypothetical protein IPM40_19765 [Gammaproteobacteria bacterium]|nr:hypothetical protein [Gammaproteobacteria bacterium]